MMRNKKYILFLFIALLGGVLGYVLLTKQPRLVLIDVHNHTRKISQTRYAEESKRLRHSSHIVPPLLESIQRQGRYSTVIDVQNQTTFEAVRALVSQGFNPLVLDMANAETPGGGVLRGSRAQEEHVCRQSNLYEGLEVLAAQYPLPEWGGAICPKVIFFKTDQYSLLSKEEAVAADVFVSAAYICNTEWKGVGRRRPESDAEYEVRTKATIRTMFRFGLKNNNDSLVLSAFGCGAFKNNPEKMAGWYKEILEEPEFEGQYKRICFAIIEDRNSPGNFQVFSRIIANVP